MAEHERVSRDEAERRFGAAVYGDKSIGSLTEYERWLLARYVDGSATPRSSAFSYWGPGRPWAEIPASPALREEVARALDRWEWHQAQRERFFDWLESHGFDFAADSFDREEFERSMAKDFPPARAAADAATSVPAAPNLPAASAIAPVTLAAVAATMPAEASADTAPPERTRRKQHKKDAEADANLANRILAVIAEARRKWPDAAKRPLASEMVEQLTGMAKGRGFKPETVRQIIRGSYRPMKRLGIKPL